MKNPAVIEAYLKFTRSKDKDQFRSVAVTPSVSLLWVCLITVGVSHRCV